jgi:hypothetical protein
MTVQRFRERELAQRLSELYVQPMPTYRDELLQEAAATPQRPGWAFPERWLPTSVVTSRVATAPSIRWRTVALLGLLLIVLVAGTVLVVGSQRAKLPPPFGPAANGSLLYSWQGDILVRDDLAGPARVLVGGDPWDTAPSYSPDGTRFAFLRDLGGAMHPGDRELWVGGADGSAPLRVGGPYTDCCWIDWSPSGDRIAVSHTDDGVDVIDIVRTDGGGTTRVPVDYPITFPTFRPADGSQLLFRGRVVDGKGWALYVANADGSSPRRLAFETDAGYGSDDDFVDPAWSADGSRLAFSVVDRVDGAPGGTAQRIHIADIARDGTITGERRLTTTIDAEAEFAPMWLPTGDAVVYRAWRGTGEELHQATVEGDAEATYLGVSAGSGILTSVSPDGTQALAVNTNTHLLYVIDLASGAVAQHFNAEDFASYQRRALP